MVQTFGVIGSGSWATALVKILTDNGNTVNWWIRNEKSIEHIQRRRHNPHYLHSVNFDVSLLSMSANIDQVVKSSDILIIAVPSAYIEQSIGHLKPQDWEGKKIVSAVKGILPEQNILLNYYLQQKFNFLMEDYFAVSGALSCRRSSSGEIVLPDFFRVGCSYCINHCVSFFNRLH